jgi:hypothetical protein
MTTLRAAVQKYLTLRRALGFKLREAGTRLLEFVAFMEQHRASYITTQLALTWAQEPSGVQPAEWARRLSIVRVFARHRRATDPRTEIPPDGLLPYRPRRARPYLYLRRSREMTRVCSREGDRRSCRRRWPSMVDAQEAPVQHLPAVVLSGSTSRPEAAGLFGAVVPGGAAGADAGVVAAT